MNTARPRPWPLIFLLIAVAACAGGWALGQVRSLRDRSEVANITETMKTVCVGRHLIDVPTQAEVSLSHERVAGFAIDTVEEDEAAFRSRVAAREAEVSRPELTGHHRGGMVGVRELHVPDMIGRTMMFGRNRGYLMEGDRRVEDEFLSVEVHAHSRGLSFTLSAPYADEARVRLAEALLARLRVRGEDEIPSEPGFCIRRALFAEPLPVRKAESIAMHLRLPGHADLALDYVSMPGGGADLGLLARVAETDAAAGADEVLRVTKLRLGRRKINGMDGEEALERMKELNLANTYAFIWETNGAADDPSRPFLSLELQGGISSQPGGKPADTSLHEDAVLVLWDKISSSIRLRPAPTQTRRPEAPQLAAE